MWLVDTTELHILIFKILHYHRVDQDRSNANVDWLSESSIFLVIIIQPVDFAELHDVEWMS